jgi:hypothetical protein
MGLPSCVSKQVRLSCFIALSGGFQGGFSGHSPTSHNGEERRQRAGAQVPGSPASLPGGHSLTV